MAVVTAVAVAVNEAVVALAATVTEAGTVTALLLLESVTARPPEPAAALSVTVQASVVAPLSDALLHETALSTPAAAVPFPLSVTTLVPPVPALLLIVMDPLAAPVLVGAKCTVSVAVCPGFSVAGKLAPVIVNPVPASVAEFSVSAAVPDEVSVTVCVPDVFTVTSPNARSVELTVSCGDPPVSCRAKVFVALPAVAVRVSVSVVLTAATVALKLALVALAATVTEAGIVTELLLLDRFTTCPPVPAAALSVTVQVSVPAFVYELVLQERALSTPGIASPVPLSVTTLLAPLAALLPTVSAPAAAPVAVGAKCTSTVADCPGFSVTGKVAPVIVKPAPEAVAELMVTAAVPDEVSVTGCGVALLLIVTSPNDRLLVLSVSCGVEAVSCRAKVFATAPAVAVSVALAFVLTAATVALNEALAAFAATVTEAGTVTELLLLDRLTTCPPVPAAALSVTVQVSVPACV